MRCASRSAHVERYDDTVDFKGLVLDVAGLARMRCSVCQYEWETPEQEAQNRSLLHGAFSTKRERVRERDDLLTGKQIEFVLRELDLSKSEAASLFGGGPNAFAKYIRGDVLQSVPMDRLLRLTLAFGGHALAYLRQGKAAPLVAWAGGFIHFPTATAQCSFAAQEAVPDGIHMRTVLPSTAAHTMVTGGA